MESWKCWFLVGSAVSCLREAMMVKETRQKLHWLGIPGSAVCPAIDLFLSADHRQKVQYHPIHLESSVPLVF